MILCAQCTIILFLQLDICTLTFFFLSRYLFFLHVPSYVAFFACTMFYIHVSSSSCIVSVLYLHVLYSSCGFLTFYIHPRREKKWTTKIIPRRTFSQLYLNEQQKVDHFSQPFLYIKKDFPHLIQRRIAKHD